MNPALVWKALPVMLSFKKELKIICAVLVGVALLPVLLVIMLTQIGITSLGSVLATSNPQTLQIDIHDPATGAVVDHISGTGIWPVHGVVTLEFGQNDLPYQPMHTGIDIADPNHQVGTPVGAFLDGTVITVGHLNWGFGNYVVLDNGHHVTSTYGHLDSTAVAVGQVVKVGDILGLRGTTGWSTGPHLHFQIDVFGIPVNPRIFLSGNP
jgi:murein DD-endopeptidase MepM/ murein hydrolase activator NlpD